MATNGKEYKLAIRIAGAIDKSFSTTLVAANTSLKRTVASMDKDFTKLDKGYNSIMSAGRKCFSVITTAAGVATAAISAATAASIKVGSEFESAFAGVKKTVDATDEGYAKLRQDILDMTRVIPSSAADIAGVMEIAGQLGIATDSLTDFTETMINLGVSTDMSAEDAATSLAKFANIVNMADYGEDGISNFERLGSVVVDLGNNFATTEADIVTMATRLASTGYMVGLTESQIMALATSMSSVGIKAEAGGSAMSKLLKKMQLAVETNSVALKDYASVSGMTADQFSKAFKEDAVVALSAFIDGLDDTERNGKSAIAVLDDMGLKEIRLSNTIMSLANAEGVMSEAISTANEAWNENTALAIEAGKRYETLESKIFLMKNAFEELGIAAYDESRELFVGVVETTTDKVHSLTSYIGGPNGISKWMNDIGTGLPTLQRKVKKYGGEILDFFNPLLSIGKWFLKNPRVIVSALTGIGASLVAYKTASNITHVVTALMEFKAMNPVTQGIMGVVAAIGLLTAAVMAYKQYQVELAESSLAEHFGTVALSMEEIQAAADHILSSDSLGGVKKALEAFEDLDSISATMENSVSEINKMNWKVSIGMELTPDEQEQYKTAIADYVSAAQDYALQSQYAVSLNLTMGMGDSKEGANIVSKVEQFYQSSYDEMVGLGEDLSQAVNDAFADNILDPKEIDEIANIQAKIAEVQQSLATGEFDAALSMLGTEYTAGGALDYNAFLNLQEELNTQIESAKAAYQESYTKNYASLSAAHDSGSLLDAEFENAIQILKDEYLKNVADLNVKSATFQVDTIMGAYSEELKGNIAAIQEGITSELNALLEKDYTSKEDWRMGLDNAMLNVGSSIDIDKDDKYALSKLYETLQPQLQQLKDLAAEFTAAGEEIPTEISSAIDNIYAIGAVSGNTAALWEMFGNEIGESEEYATVIALCQEVGSNIPHEIIDAMTNDGVMAEVSQNVDYILESIESQFQEGIDVTIPVYYGLSTYGINARRAGIAAAEANVLENANHRATGGLATRPELTWFAENGPEMAIPIDGSKNAVSLWEQTGRLLGMDSVLDGLSLEGSSGPAISYSPTLQFYGEAPSKDDLTDALRVSQDEFESLMERYIKTHGRVAFS